MVLDLTIKVLGVKSNHSHAIISIEDARKLNVKEGDRIVARKRFSKEVFVVQVDYEHDIANEGELVLYSENNFKEGEKVRVRTALAPKSKEIIRKKLNGGELKPEEIKLLVDDIYNDRLTEVELSSYLTSVYIHGFSFKETVALTKEMYRYGERITWPRHWKVVDKHSIGGVPGNRTTPIVVPILAALGLKVPKTSSRSITSPAGTADTIEVLADVEFSSEEIKKLVRKTNACMVWGGALDLAPVDDKLIKVEHPLNIDPEGQVIASILSKKKSVGSKYVLIDIPYGEGSKINSLEDAKLLAHKFKIVGAKIDMDVDVIITKGSQPIGNGIGPVLEMIDILQVLYGKGPSDLREKSLEMAGIVLSMTGKGNYDTAKEVLDSGKAFKKFKEIIEAQNGSVAKSLTDMLEQEVYDVVAKNDGVVEHINNKLIAEIAKRAGAPAYKGAGVYLFKKVGDHVKKGEKLFRIYAASSRMMDYALEALKDAEPYVVAKKQNFIISKVM